MLLDAQDEDGNRMSDRQVRDEVMTLILAGHETTALMLSWLWMLVARYPEVESQLHRELLAVLGDRSPTLEDLPRLTYTEMVVREALRLYPPTVELGRETVQEVEIGGYRLPAGTNVMFTPYTVHRDARWFDDPDAFRPERWADRLAQRIPRFAYFPFGGGPRVCLGQQFALIEAVLVVADIARQYRLILEANTEVRPDPTLTLRLKNGLPMRVEVYRRN
jgi:cytochrome P450